MPATDGRRRENDHNDAAHLEDRHEVVESGTRSDRAEVDSHEEPDQPHRNQIDDRNDAPHRRIFGQEGKEVACVDDEALECRRDRGGKPRNEGDEGAHEPRGRAIRFAQVDVLPPCAGHHGSQFGITEGAEQGESPTDHPQREDEERIPEISGLKPRGGEDSRADHIGDHEGRGGAQAHVPRQRSPSLGHDQTSHEDGPKGEGTSRKRCGASILAREALVRLRWVPATPPRDLPDPLR